MLLKNDRVSGVAFVHCICKVADEGNKTNDKVDEDIDHHHHAQVRWESALDLLAISHDHHGQGSVAGITDTIVGPVSLGSTKEMDRRYSQWDETNHTAPTEPDTAQVEKGVVELISSALNAREDFRIVF